MKDEARTVNGNGNGLSQEEAIRAHEGWNSIERVEFEVFGICSGRLDLYKFNVEIVGLCDGEEDC